MYRSSISSGLSLNPLFIGLSDLQRSTDPSLYVSLILIVFPFLYLLY